MRKIPKLNLSQLKSQNKEAYKVMQTIIRGLMELHWGFLKSLDLGMEATLEGIEELIEKGFLKITQNEEGFFFEYYDINSDCYKKCGE